MIGNNASGIEIKGADAIVENLFNLTGNMPVIKTDDEITGDELAGHNLIVVSGADLSEVLREVGNITDAMRVTEEYPGAGKGVRGILRSPWDHENALLLAAGSDDRWCGHAPYSCVEYTATANKRRNKTSEVKTCEKT